MKKLILTLFLLFSFSVITRAQVLTPPEFPGGENAFRTFLAKNLKWPDKSIASQGIVTIGFVVEKDGQLTNIHVAKSLSAGFDKEALRVINLSPKWVPARQNNKFIKSNYSVPISFIKQAIRPVKVKDIQLSAGNDADITIDEPIAENDANDPPDKIYTSVEKVPQFPGGIQKFYDYVQENLKNEKISANDEGKVIVTFVTEKDGNLTAITVVRGVSEKSDSLALKIIKNSPKWAPGTRNGKPVRVAYAVPINIKANI